VRSILFDSDFNYDFQVSHTQEEWQSGAVEYNFRAMDLRLAEQSPVAAELASRVGTDFATYRREGPGVSAFALEDGVHVPVARPHAARAQRDRLLVAPPRRVRQPVTGRDGFTPEPGRSPRVAHR
jgi:predicted dithiol-disulfide oxidoreductase (DUF899 family)